MGQEESQQVAAPPVEEPAQEEEEHEEEILEYEGIPEIESLVIHDKDNPEIPEEYCLPSGSLPDAHMDAKKYFHSLAFHINRNEEKLYGQIKYQIETYSALSRRLGKRHSELDKNLASLHSCFKELDESIQKTTDNLSLAIKKVDLLAKIIDPGFTTFEEYQSQ